MRKALAATIFAMLAASLAGLLAGLLMLKALGQPTPLG